MWPWKKGSGPSSSTQLWVISKSLWQTLYISQNSLQKQNQWAVHIQRLVIRSWLTQSGRLTSSAAIKLEAPESWSFRSSPRPKAWCQEKGGCVSRLGAQEELTLHSSPKEGSGPQCSSSKTVRQEEFPHIYGGSAFLGYSGLQQPPLLGLQIRMLLSSKNTFTEQWPSGWAPPWTEGTKD